MKIYRMKLEAKGSIRIVHVMCVPRESSPSLKERFWTCNVTQANVQCISLFRLSWNRGFGSDYPRISIIPGGGEEPPLMEFSCKLLVCFAEPCSSSCCGRGCTLMSHLLACRASSLHLCRRLWFITVRRFKLFLYGFFRNLSWHLAVYRPNYETTFVVMRLKFIDCQCRSPDWGYHSLSSNSVLPKGSRIYITFNLPVMLVGFYPVVSTRNGERRRLHMQILPDEVRTSSYH